MEVFDYLEMKAEGALHPDPSGRPFLDRLREKWTPEGEPVPWRRVDCAGTFLEYFMGLSAIGHDKARDAYQACLRWCQLALDIAGPEHIYERFRTRYYLSNAHWLWEGRSPAELIPPMVAAAVEYEGVAERHRAITYARLSFAHAQAGDWEAALRVLSKARGSRPIVLHTRGAMSPMQALAWGYGQMASGQPAPPEMRLRYAAAMRKHIQSEDGLLLDSFIWLRLYQTLFEPEARPADLLQLLRPERPLPS